MTNDVIISNKLESEFHPQGGDKPRKPYKKPCLEELGDLRTLTLGPSPGPFDSGGMSNPPF
jgi:hypothetical protein